MSCAKFLKYGDLNNQNNQPRDLSRKIRHITRDIKARAWDVKDHTGTLKTNRENIAEKLYCRDLYKDDEFQEVVYQIPEEIEEEPNVLENEIILAISKLKNDKAPGPDMITVEMLKATEETGTKSTITTNHKKCSFHKCDNYRTISLISHACQIMLHIINERLKTFL
ncbi:uncharacterized protein [Diabrotica undecimpunctata]|uniref:uncharacterized protein n=1 Tax=Diabrotica undecimpunctata TaxID=50387 RepID=UPI003B641817